MIQHIKHIVFTCIFLWSYLGIGQTTTIPDAAFLAFLKNHHEGLLDNSDRLIISNAAAFPDTLKMAGQSIKNLEGIQYFTSLRGLDVSGNELTTIPAINNLASLQTLNVRNNKLVSLPQLSTLSNLTNIYADHNLLVTLPNLSQNTKLLSLQVSHNLLQSLPAIGTLVRLNILDVSFNALTVLPSINTLSSLERLYASDNMLDTLPQMHLLTTLKRFDVSNNLLRTLPDLSKNPQLGELVADNNLLTVAPYLGSLSMLKKIQLQDNRLTFDDLAQYIGRADSAYLDYSPQKNTGTLRNVDVKPDEPITLVPSIGDTLKGIVYAWYRNGSLLAKSTSKLYTINATQPADSGKYYCKLTHPRFPTLTLVCDTLRLRVSNSEPETTCPKLKQAVVDITSPECTEVGTLRLSFAPGLLDSISLALYDSTQSLIPGVSKTFYDHIKQGEYHLLMRPTDPTCAFAFDQKIVVKARKCYEVVLTPNNDGKDDILYFNQKGTATIYDKNGKFIKTLQIPTEWDGSHSEGLLPQGYYYVKINDGRESFNLSIIY